MRRIKKEQLFNDPSYDQLSDRLLAESYGLVTEIRTLLLEKNVTGIGLAENVLLMQNGAWEVPAANGSSIILSPYIDLEIVLGHLVSIADEEPDSVFFRLEPNIKKAQAGQIFVGMLKQARQSLQSMDARTLPR